ncbi:MAG: hypothetical protein JXA69_08985 [Phycisphaerae bacterium]|nr:hypothetical protein [Phycisphaerae bacterium]
MQPHNAYRVARLAGAAALILLACRKDETPPAAPAPPSTDAAATAPQGPLRPPPTPPPAAEPPTEAPVRPPTPPIPAVGHLNTVHPATSPLADAKVGEWAHYAAKDGGVVAYRILRVEPELVHVETQMLVDGQPLGLPVVRAEPLSCDPIRIDAERVGADVAWENATVEAAGRTWPCRLATTTWTDEDVHYIRRTWYSDAAPMYGTVKMELLADGKSAASLVLIGYGEP